MQIFLGVAATVTAARELKSFVAAARELNSPMAAARRNNTRFEEAVRKQGILHSLEYAYDLQSEIVSDGGIVLDSTCTIVTLRAKRSISYETKGSTV